MAKRQVRYTRAERKAYQSGKGYALAKAGKGINFKSDNLERAFRAGLAKGNEAAKNNPLKYPTLPKRKKRGKK